MKKFKIPATKRNLKFKIFTHIDCYRIKNLKEILTLDFLEMISNPKNIIAIEWAERISDILPKNTIWIKFVIDNQNRRKITLLIKPTKVK